MHKTREMALRFLGPHRRVRSQCLMALKALLVEPEHRRFVSPQA
jgi:hypothetical protein